MTLGGGSNPSCGMHSSTGTDFVFGLPHVFSYQNQYQQSQYAQYHKYVLYISASTLGRLYIDAPSAKLHRVEHILQGGTKLELPYKLLQTTDETVENKGIRLRSDVPISASLFVTAGNSYNAGGVVCILLLPTSALSTDYVVASSRSKSDGGSTSNTNTFLIAATQNLTIVTITFPNGIAPSPRHVLMDETQTYSFNHAGDLSNVKIHSDRPVAVVSSVSEASIPSSVSSSESIASFIPPNTFSGYNFLVPALPKRVHYVVRIFATEDATSVTLRNSSSQTPTRIYSDLFDEYMFGDDAVTIESDKPILVYQYGTAYNSNGEHYGAFMRNIPAVENYVSDVRFIIQDEIQNINNYVQVIFPHGSMVILDSLPIGFNIGSGSLAHEYTVRGQKYSVISLSVPESVDTVNGARGFHRIFSQFGDVRFAALLSGYNMSRQEAYGIPLGMQSSDCHVNQGALSTAAPTVNVSVVNTSYEYAIRSLCFQCDDMSHLFLCDTFTKCGSSMGPSEQVCYVEKYTSPSNQTRFRSGCKESNLCPAKKRQAPEMASAKVNSHSRETRASAEKCTECCGHGLCNTHGCGEQAPAELSDQGGLYLQKTTQVTWDSVSRETRASDKCTECCGQGLCNTHGCGEQAPPSTFRGPLCMSCQHVAMLEECTTVVPCAKNEVCHIEGVDYGIYKHYKLGCKPAQECKAEVKKHRTGSRKRRGTLMCTYCWDKKF